MKKLLLSSILVVMILLPFVGQAAEPEKTYTFLAPLSTKTDNTPISSDLPGYLQDMFKIVLGVAGVLAVIMIMRGGIMYITAGDNESSVGEAKDIIRSAIFGLLLAIMSFLIIQTLNPSALNFSINPVVTGSYCFFYNNRVYIKNADGTETFDESATLDSPQITVCAETLGDCNIKRIDASNTKFDSYAMTSCAKRD